MTLPIPAQTLFEAFERKIDRFTKALSNDVFSTYRDFPWKHEDRNQLRQMIRKQLENYTMSMLGTFDNVGCTLESPDGTIGYNIHNYYEMVDDEGVSDVLRGPDIRLDEMDYADMWAEFLLDRAG